MPTQQIYWLSRLIVESRMQPYPENKQTNKQIKKKNEIKTKTKTKNS